MYRQSLDLSVLSTMHYTDGESAVSVRTYCVHCFTCTRTDVVGEGSYLT
jgi:hypothetical protein